MSVRRIRGSNSPLSQQPLADTKTPGDNGRVETSPYAVAAAIAHEIKQPLAAMVTQANAGVRWLDRPLPDCDRAKLAFEKIAADGLRAEAVIEGIRASVRKDDRNKSPLSVNKLIEETLAVLHDDLQKNRILVQAEPNDQLPLVRGDRIQLQQVLLNLITNAIESMAKEETRILRVRADVHDAGGVVVSVSDTGAGISSQDVDQIFNPLVTTKVGGMGMGLWICRSIIEAHDGRLWVAQNIPRGTVFQFVLRSEPRRLCAFR